MQVESEDFAGFFKAYGWRFERQSEGVYRTAFEGDAGAHEIWIRVADAWVYFTVNPFLAAPEGEDHGEDVLGLLLRANFEVNLAKFAVDESGDVLLTVELPREGFSYSHFADALTALAHYADHWRAPFERAAGRDADEVV
jgi:hypothetical protein